MAAEQAIGWWAEHGATVSRAREASRARSDRRRCYQLRRLVDRRDGGSFEFPGMSAIGFDDEGHIISQMDLYDRVTALRVISEARVPGVERMLGGATRLSQPFIDVVHSLVGQKR